MNLDNDPVSQNKKKMENNYKSLLESIKNHSANLFNSDDLEHDVSSYNVVHESEIQDSNLLRSQNPGLLAYRTKNEKYNVKHNNASLSHVVPITKPMNSLLSKKGAEKPKRMKISSIQLLKSKAEAEKDSINFDEDPIAYFSKRKDGRGHRFIYLIPKNQPCDFDYNPYDLQKVPFIEPHIKEYYTMTATGITHVQKDGNTDNLSLDEWASETSKFAILKKIKFFRYYSFWRPFLIWVNHMKTRNFRNKLGKILDHPFFSDSLFFKTLLNIQKSRENLEDIVQCTLSAFSNSKKYDLNEFSSMNENNWGNLNKQYNSYVSMICNNILELYNVISDPKHVQVNDSDFPEIQRRNFNIEQLQMFEKKKAIARAEKTETANRKIMIIPSFIRVSQYMMLESLTKAATKCWKSALNELSQEMASIFRVEVFFNQQGQVCFEPSLDQLLGSIKTCFKEARNNMFHLKPLIEKQEMQPFLKECGINLYNLKFKGGKLSLFLLNYANTKNQSSKKISPEENSILMVYEENMLAIILKSYEQSLQSSQGYAEFYPIFQLSQTWNVNQYLLTRSGQPYNGNLDSSNRNELDDEFLINSDKEPVVDFKRIYHDIALFQEYETKVSSLRPGLVKLALYVDSKMLRQEITPIPTNVLKDLIKMLDQLGQVKIDKVQRALRYYNRQLKTEPQNLDQFVEFCRFLKRTQEMVPQISTEIIFIDSLYELFDSIGIEHPRNPLHSMLTSLKVDQSTASTNKNAFKEPFIKSLKDIVRETEKQIAHYYEKATTIPVSLKDADIEIRLPAAQKIKNKVDSLGPKIYEIVEFQNIVGVEINDFSAYKNVVGAADFAINLYQTAQKWNSLNGIISKKQFSQIDIHIFKKDINQILNEVQKLLEIGKSNYPMLLELSNRVTDILPHIEALELLSGGNMQIRHWNLLFDECGKPGNYHVDITIFELLQNEILQKISLIKRITQTSQGESNLESQYQMINNHWNKVILPIIKNQSKSDENLTIGNTDNLINEIIDSIVNLQTMLNMSYVQGIRDSVLFLISVLENCISILRAWQIFQKNWIILSPLFSLDDSRSILPHQANRFASIQRKWISVARHASKDQRLLSICSFPSLLELFVENNNSAESIFIALSKYLDAKRNMVPRLYFLSNNEVLTLLTTSNFSSFEGVIVNILMNVDHLECRGSEIDESAIQIPQYSQPSFTKLKIYGLLGKDGSLFHFQRSISCYGGIESWIPQLLEMMKKSLQNSIQTSIPSCNNQSFAGWIQSTPIYIVISVLSIVFAKDVEEIFRNLGKGARAFLPLQESLSLKEIELRDSLTTNYSSLNYHKVSTIVSHLIHLKDIVSKLSSIGTNQSHQLTWEGILKHEYSENSNTLNINYNKCSWEHGLEFYGDVPAFIITPSINNAMTSVLTYLSSKCVPVVSGSPNCGKKSLFKYIAMLFGRFSYTARSFPDINEFYLSKILTGIASSGSWLIVSNIDSLSLTNSSYIFDNIKSLSIAQNVGNPRITISSRLVDLDKNSRVMLTSSPYYFSSDSIPSQIKAYYRSVSLVSPDFVNLIEIKLLSLTIPDPKDIAKKIYFFIYVVLRTFDTELVFPHISHHVFSILNVIEKQTKFFKPKSDRVLGIAYICYVHFCSRLKGDYITSLKDIVYNTFHIGNNSNEMYQKMQEISILMNKTEFERMALDEIPYFGNDIPINYLISQSYKLFIIMQNESFVIISGPSNSGKSIVLSLLAKIFERKDFKEIYPLIYPMKLMECFYAADEWNSVFGHVVNDLTLGQLWAYGYINSLLQQITETQNSKLGILKFDGSITPAFALYLSQMIECNSTCQITSMDKFSLGNNFKIVLETDSLKNMTPLLISKAKILLMEVIFEKSLDKNQKNSNLPIYFSVYSMLRASEQLNIELSSSTMKAIHSNFNKFGSIVIGKVFESKNYVFYYNEPNSMLYGDSLISDSLFGFSVILAFYFLNQRLIDTTNQNQMKLLVVYCLYHVFSSIMDYSESITFESWIRQTFDIDTPTEWTDFKYPELFTKNFPKPSLNSMRIYNGKLIPLDYNSLDSQSFIKMPSMVKLPSLSQETIYYTPQLLIPLNLLHGYLSSKQHVIIHGPQASGKTSLIRLFFENNSDFVPVFIPVSMMNLSKLLVFLNDHSLVSSSIRNSGSLKKNYVLVFDNIDKNDYQTIETIRLLIKTARIPVFSTSDNKMNDSVIIHHFVVVVITRDYCMFPSRFISLFAPIQVFPISQSVSKYISEKLLQEAGYSENIIHGILQSTIQLLKDVRRKEFISDILSITVPFSFLNSKDNVSQVISLLIFQLFSVSITSYSEKESLDKVISIIKSVFSQSEYENILESFYKEDVVVSCEYSYRGSSSTPFSRIVFHSIDDLSRELQFHLNVFNTNSAEKLFIRFTNHVVKQYVTLLSLISCPGKNLVLYGSTGSGRYSLCRLISNVCERDFVYLSLPTPEELLNPHERKLTLIQLLKDVISNAVLHQKSSVIFVRSSNSNEYEAKIFADIVQKCDFVNLFSKEGLEDLYSKLHNSKPTSYDTRLLLIEKIRAIIRSKIHVIISSETPIDFAYASHFDYIQIESEKDIFYSNLAHEAANDSSLKAVYGRLIPKFDELLFLSYQIAKSNMPFFHQNHYYDFVFMFIEQARINYESSFAYLSQINDAVSLYTKASEDIKMINGSLEEIKPQLTKIQAETNSLEQAYITRREAIDARRIKLDEDNLLKQQTVSKLEELVKIEEIELNSLRPRIMNNYKIIEEINENDIETIRITATSPLDSLRILLELICMILGFPKEYENGGKPLLEKGNFFKQLIDFFVDHPMNYEQYKRIMPYIEKDLINVYELESISPSLKSLYEWICSITKLYNIENTLTAHKKSLEDEKRGLAQFQEEIILEKSSIKQVEESLEKELIHLTSEMDMRKSLENEYDIVEKRKISVDSIMKDSLDIIEKWKLSSEESERELEQCIVEALFYSFYVSFCGSMEMKKRYDSLQKIIIGINQKGIEYLISPMEIINQKLLMYNGEIKSQSLQPFHYSSFNDAVHIFVSHRVSCLIDTDDLVLSILQTSIKPKRLVILSQNCSNLETVLYNAINDGKVIVLLDADSIHPLVSPLLNLFYLDLETCSKEIKIGSKIAKLDPRFRLILVSSVSEQKDLNPSFLSRVNIINVMFSANDSSKFFIKNAFLEFFLPNYPTKLESEMKESFIYRNQLNSAENDILENMSDMYHNIIENADYDYLSDSESISDLVQSKEWYYRVSKKKFDLESINKEIQSHLNPFNVHIELCVTIWDVISRSMTTISSFAKFNITSYLKMLNSVFVNEGLHSGYLSNEQNILLQKSLIMATINFVFPSLSINESLFFLFYLGVKLLNKDGKLPNSDLDMILSHINEQNNSVVDFSPQFIDGGSPLELMKYANIVGLFPLITSFIRSVFDIDFMSILTGFQVDTVVSNSSTTPSVILCKSEVDPSSLLHLFLSMRCRNDNFESYSLSNDIEVIKNTRKMLQNAINKGSWILLHYSQPNRAIADMLIDILTQISTSSVNTNFRLILLANSVDFLSPTILRRSKRTYIDSFTPFRNSMIQYLHHSSSNIRSNGNPKLMKKLSYSIALTISIINYLSMFDHIGIPSYVRVNDISFKETIEWLRTITDVSNIDIPLQNLRDYIINVTYAFILDGKDKKRIECLVNAIFVPEMLEDGYSIDRTSVDSNRWIIPSDIPVSELTNISKELPSIVPVGILRMDQKAFGPLIEWAISKWAIEPILKHSIHDMSFSNELVESKIESLSMLLPDFLPYLPVPSDKISMDYVLYREVKMFNKVLGIIRHFLKNLNTKMTDSIIVDDAKTIAQGLIPSEWKKIANYTSSKHINKFVTHIIEQHQFLSNWISNGVPVLIPGNLIYGLRKLLMTYFIIKANEESIPYDQAVFEFKFASHQHQVQPNEIIIKNLYLMGGSVYNGGLFLVNDHKIDAIQPVPALCCTVLSKASTKIQKFECPLYHSLIVNKINKGIMSSMINEGSSDNLIWKVSLNTNRPEKDWILSNTSLYCNVPEEFL